MSALSGATKRIALLCCCLVAKGVFGYRFNHTCTHVHTHAHANNRSAKHEQMNMNKSFVVFQSSFCHSKSLTHNHDGCQKGSVYCYQVRNVSLELNTATRRSFNVLYGICNSMYQKFLF